MARYMVERNYVQVIGKIWLPSITAAMECPLDRYDLENMRDEETGEITRDDIERWVGLHTGDFATITDFCASIGDTDYPWADEESEFTYHDCMYGSDDE